MPGKTIIRNLTNRLEATQHNIHSNALFLSKSFHTPDGGGVLEKVEQFSIRENHIDAELVCFPFLGIALSRFVLLVCVDIDKNLFLAVQNKVCKLVEQTEPKGSNPASPQRKLNERLVRLQEA